MELKELKEKAKNLEPIVRLGKNGLNENVLVEIEKLLKKRKLIKIKILNNCPQDKNEIIDIVIQKTNAIIIGKIGNVFSIFREKQQK